MRFLTIDSLEKTLKVVFVIFCMAFFSAPAFSGFATSERKHTSSDDSKDKTTKEESSINEEPSKSESESSTRNSNQDQKQVRSIINDGTSRIVKSLGCLAEDDNDQFDKMVQEWGSKINGLGLEPKMITDNTRYSSYLTFVAWDYLKSDKICNSTSNRCYQRLYKPLANLFSVFRDSKNEKEIKERVETLKNEIKDQVIAMRQNASTGYEKPPCVPVGEIKQQNAESKDKQDSEKRSYVKEESVEDKEKVAKQAPEDHFDSDAAPTSKKSEKSYSDQKGLDITPVARPERRLGSGDAKLAAYRDALLKANANPQAVDHALKFFADNREKFKNQNYISVIDATKRSSEEPYFLLNTQTLEVKRYDVSYGRGSVDGRNRIPTNFSRANVSGSYQTPPGAILVGEKTTGSSHSRVTLLHGLESRNRATLSRSVIMHDASYVRSGGRSWGCPAFDPRDFREIQPLISGGSFLYIYSPYADKDYRSDSRTT